MGTPINFNGVSYTVPAFGDVGYAQGPGNLSAYLIAIATGSLQQTGGSFPLTSQVNFGNSFGITAVDFISTTANPATVGVLRLAKTDAIAWRNNLNTLNLPLAINGADQLTFNGNIISGTGTGPVQTVSGTTNQINSTGGANPVLSLSSTLIIPGTFTIPAVTNQIVLGTTNTVTLTSPAPAASRVYTIPDVLANAFFVMTEGTQTINGAKTFGNAIDTSAVTHTGGVDIQGTDTNDSASAGFVGEYIESVVSAVTAPTSGNFGDLTSISLTAGDWDVTALAYVAIGAGAWQLIQIGISTTPGNSTAGLVAGSNRLLDSWASSATTPTEQSLTIAAYRVSLSATTTIYFKFESTYVVAPTFFGRISARRVR